MAIFFRPAESVAADFIPFCWQGRYHLFYLRDYRNEAVHGQGTPWWQIVTDDFVDFADWGEALPRGAQDAQDLWVFTGCVFEHEGAFTIFYTGHNRHFKAEGRANEAVLRATSQDLRTWQKEPDFAFFAPDGYEAHDWRDPFVFWNEEAGEFWMLLAARQPEGPSRNRGCTALAASPDLRQWRVREPFWAPQLYYTHECPDLFRIGDWWYLLYSTFSERHVTHYRMSRSLQGPWLAPANDAFDGRGYYAAKSAGDGERRFLFGWLATREGESAEGRWQWGGDLVVHELKQEQDGSLTVHSPEQVLAVFDQRLSPTPQARLGNWQVEPALSCASVGRFSTLSLGDLPEECLLEATITFGAETYSCGLLLRCDDDLDCYYQVRLEPAQQRLVVDRWPRPGDQPFMLERPLAMTAGSPVRIQVLISGTCLVVYANEQVALSCRLYNQRRGGWGLFVAEGEARFADLVLATRTASETAH